MTKCPDCRKYDCECETNPELIPGIVTKTLKESSFEMLMQIQPGRLPSHPVKVEITCPKCDGKGYIPNPILSGDDPCHSCGSTGIILVRESYTYGNIY